MFDLYGDRDVDVPRCSSWIDDLFKSFNFIVKDEDSDYSSSFPPCNVFYEESDAGVDIELALAGYKKDELSVSVDTDSVTISAKPIKAEDEKKGSYFKHRIKKEEFTKSYDLPVGKYDTDTTEVSYEDGILAIHINAKKEVEPQRKTITIK